LGIFLVPTLAHDAGVAPPLGLLPVCDEPELEVVELLEPLEVVEVLLPQAAAPVNSRARARSSGSGRRSLPRRDGWRLVGRVADIVFLSVDRLAGSLPGLLTARAS